MIHASLLVLVCTGAGLSGCAPQQTTIRGPRALPADSAAMLASAIRAARPAFLTQDEALRAGVYRSFAAPTLAVQPTPAPPAPPRTPTPSPPATRSEIPAPAPARTGRHVVQIAAFSDLASAQRSAMEASREFPDLPTQVEEQSGLFRVSLGGWNDAAAADEQLNRIREMYPSAWVRARPLP